MIGDVTNVSNRVLKTIGTEISQTFLDAAKEQNEYVSYQLILTKY